MGLPKIVIYCALVNIVGGLLFGYAIGFVPIYTTFNEMNTDCTGLKDQDACASVKHAACFWSPINATYGECLYRDHAANPCRQQTNQSSCDVYPACAWDFSKTRCQHSPAWTPSQTGLFATAMIVGGLFGSTFAAKVVSLLGTKKTIFASAMIGLLSTMCVTIARAEGVFALLVIGRVLLGLACGFACVACPLYVGEMTPAAYSGPVGVLFQVACTFGIFLAASMGLILQPHSFTGDMKMELRFQILIGVQWLVSGALVPVSMIIPPLTSEKQGDEPEKEAIVVKTINRNTLPAGESDIPFRALLIPLIGSIALCSAQQLTGINAVMNYAPSITAAAGLAPLTGNFIVMFWNFVTTLVSIPLAKRFSARRLFITATVVASTSCLLTGIAIFPGVISSATPRHVLACLGIVVFIAAFEMGMGPTFWIHAQSLFPGKYRGPGCSFTLVFQFILNIIINFAFPVSVVALSGGPSKDQDKGMASVFMIFGSFGAVSVMAMFKTLRPAEQEEAFIPNSELEKTSKTSD